jgi:hypothetical protein
MGWLEVEVHDYGEVARIRREEAAERLKQGSTDLVHMADYTQWLAACVLMGDVDPDTGRRALAMAQSQFVDNCRRCYDAIPPALPPHSHVGKQQP